jgi:hypothetical protein
MEQPAYLKRLRQSIIAERLSGEHSRLTTIEVAPLDNHLVADYTTGYAIREGRSISVIAHRSVDDSARVHGLALDLSPTGVKFRSEDDSLSLGDIIHLEMSPSTSKGILRCNAEVCWSRKNGTSANYGCAFVEEVPAETYQKFLRHLERRTHQRIDIDATAQLRRVDRPGKLPIHLLDYSDGGVGIASPKEIEVGENVVLQMDLPGKHPYISVEVRNCRPTDGGYLIGARFLPATDKSIASEFHKAALSHLKEEEEECSDTIERLDEEKTSLAWKALVVIAGLVGALSSALLLLRHWPAL